MTTLMLFAAAAGALGVALFMFGWRGRRIDDHPLCRRCGFDLTGRAPESTRCAECGADLDAPRAVRIGHRRRRTGALVAGIGLVVPAVVVLGAATFVIVRDVDLTPHKPNWLLVRDVKTAGPVGGKSLAELTRRVQSGRTISDVSAICLANQGQTTLPWDPAWGRFIEAARAAGRLPDDAWARYARQAFVLGLRMSRSPSTGTGMPNAIRPRVIEDREMFVVSMGQPRVAGAAFVGIFDWDELRLDEEQPKPLSAFSLSPPRPYHGRIDIGGTSRGMTQSTPSVDLATRADLLGGSHTFHAKLHVRVFEAKDVPPQRGRRVAPDPAKQITGMDVDVSTTFTVPDRDSTSTKTPTSAPHVYPVLLTP